MHGIYINMDTVALESPQAVRHGVAGPRVTYRAYRAYRALFPAALFSDQQVSYPKKQYFRGAVGDVGR